MAIKTVIITLALLLSGCGEIKLFEPNIEYSVDSASNDDLTILLQRFDTISSSLLSGAAISDNNGQTIITFRGGSPSDEMVQYLSQHKGQLVLVDERDRVWFTSEDVKRADVTLEKTSPYAVPDQLFLKDTLVYVDIMIDQQAADKVEALSRVSHGLDVSMVLDGKIILSAKIHGMISNFMRVSAVSEQQAQQIVAILRHGQLSQAINLKRITPFNNDK